MSASALRNEKLCFSRNNDSPKQKLNFKMRISINKMYMLSEKMRCLTGIMSVKAAIMSMLID